MSLALPEIEIRILKKIVDFERRYASRPTRLILGYETRLSLETHARSIWNFSIQQRGEAMLETYRGLEIRIAKRKEYLRVM